MAAPVSGKDTGGVRQTGGRISPADKARALERLAMARANLAGLEQRDTPAIEPAIRVQVEQRQQQIAELRREVSGGKRGRAGRQARQQIEALEGTQRLVIECLGFRSYDEFRDAADRCDATRVDQRLIAQARDEVNRAERHFFDTAEMRIPVPGPTAPPAPAPNRFAPPTRSNPAVAPATPIGAGPRKVRPVVPSSRLRPPTPRRAAS